MSATEPSHFQPFICSCGEELQLRDVERPKLGVICPTCQRTDMQPLRTCKSCHRPLPAQYGRGRPWLVCPGNKSCKTRRVAQRAREAKAVSTPADASACAGASHS